ncbi:MAG: SDR family oxidoreductase [Rhodococcus sp. (in: high G+C Gram-positive bacteria)]|uniref:SDR family NAD(P)-dependent oxidoreductase n=1 Tax=Rhodococcus sp. TaxID=1831 RepID=UPI001219F88E|nr:SDR family oxidoreductase [Rhodococcus sp. (in: high G+C Gram-positive bacteria)]RZL24536.1 MAG: SDR family oxidoreductase [Rhodococcus sp. (in: high G+C Gram-positive bacteria)]
MELSSARHAFITGGASGIGLGIADALAERGLSVTVADINRQSLDTVIASRGVGFSAVSLDVRDREAWAVAKATAESTFGPVDILVNNAGIGFNGRDVADMDPETFDNLVAIDLTGVFNGVSAFGGDMRARGYGHIVNTASVMGLTAGAPGRGAYSAAKSAVIALSEALRTEMAPHGVGVSVLCPGLVMSNLDRSTTELGGQVEDVSHIKGTGNIGMEPATAGAYVARGIAQNLPYIVTHPQYLDYVEKRMESIRASVDASTPIP